MKKASLCVVLLLLLASIGRAQTPVSVSAGSRAQGSLTTLFASNGGYRGNMFDITPKVDMTIPSIDVNCSGVGASVHVDVWYYVGTCVGHDMSSNGWTLLDSGVGVGAGMDLPTNIPLPNGSKTNFLKGQVYGIYVDFTNYPNDGVCRYSNGNKTVSNADLSITTYYGKGTPAFTGPTFSPRIWNGTIYYDDPATLSTDVDEIPSQTGGVINFHLDAGPANGNRYYALIGGVSGTKGWDLPGGLNVPVTWDTLTSLLLKIGWGIGTLDPNGVSTEALVIPANPLGFDVTMSFAFFLEGKPNWNFVSNGTDVLIKAYFGLEFRYDDGSSENSLGLIDGGELCWMHLFDSGPGETITMVSTAFGTPTAPGLCPPAGSQVTVAVWDDPNNDFDPNDGVLLGQATGFLAKPDTDILSYYMFTSPVSVTGKFVVGCGVKHLKGEYPGPMDQSSPTTPHSWVAGDASSFDYNNLRKNTLTPRSMAYIGYPCNWLLRAQ